MKFIVLPGLLFALSALAGCASMNGSYRMHALLIKHHQFSPPRIDGPAGKLLLLSIDSIDDDIVSVLSPDLGIRPHALSGNPTIRRVPGGVTVDITKRLYLELGPLTAGSYAILCDCHGREAHATLVVTQSIKPAS